jgi:hypothetical protein
VSTESPTPEELQHMLEQSQQQKSQQTDQGNPLAASQQTDQGNPLAAYMRQPQIYIKLPSGGKYWKEGSLDYPVNGELSILSMSTKDELILKSPDALINGQGVVDVIHHCVPNIKDAWEMPIIDVDTILIAIRIASYGENMEYSSACPGCSALNEYEIDLKQFLDMPVDVSNYDETVIYQDLSLKIKPQNYRSLNASSLDIFEQQRLIAVVDNENLDADEKQTKFNEIFKKMTELTIRNITGSIEYIEAPGGNRVTSRAYIDNFVENSDRSVFDNLRKRQEKINDSFPDKSVDTTCPECQHTYTVPFTFDQANFFESAS